MKLRRSKVPQDHWFPDQPKTPTGLRHHASNEQADNVMLKPVKPIQAVGCTEPASAVNNTMLARVAARRTPKCALLRPVEHCAGGGRCIVNGSDAALWGPRPA